MPEAPFHFRHIYAVDFHFHYAQIFIKDYILLLDAERHGAARRQR